MDAATSTIIGVIVGGAITMLAKWIELHYQRQADKHRNDREKLELLRSLISAAMHDFNKYSFDFLYTDNALTEDEKLRLEHERFFEIVSTWPQIHSLIRIYVPEMSDEWEKVRELSKDVSIQVLKLLRDDASENDLDDVLDANTLLREQVTVVLIGVERRLGGSVTKSPEFRFDSRESRPEALESSERD